MLTGLQGGYTKFCWVLRKWDSRASQWLLQAETILDQKNVARRAEFENTKIFVPQIHIKLGLIKIFVKVMTKEDEDSTI